MYAKCLLPHSLLLQAPYYGIRRYNDKIDSESQEAFLSFSQKQHKDNMDDFEALFELYVTKKAAGPIDSRATTKSGGTKDSIAKMLGPPKPAAIEPPRALLPPPVRPRRRRRPPPPRRPRGATPPRNHRTSPRRLRWRAPPRRPRDVPEPLRPLGGGARHRHRFAQDELGEVVAGPCGRGTAASALWPLMTGPTDPSRLRRCNGMKDVSSAQCVHAFCKGLQSKEFVCTNFMPQSLEKLCMKL
jgi:hypothetical protein